MRTGSNRLLTPAVFAALLSFPAPGTAGTIYSNLGAGDFALTLCLLRTHLWPPPLSPSSRLAEWLPSAHPALSAMQLQFPAGPTRFFLEARPNPLKLQD